MKQARIIEPGLEVALYDNRPAATADGRAEEMAPHRAAEPQWKHPQQYRSAAKTQQTQFVQRPKGKDKKKA